MIVKNNKYPDGIELRPDRSINISPCTVRQMTEEERVKYGEPSSLPVIREKAEQVWMVSDEDRAFALWLREERSKRKMTQKEFAELIGVSQPNISYWEIMRNKPSEKARKKIENALGAFGNTHRAFEVSKMSRTDDFHPGQ